MSTTNKFRTIQVCCLLLLQIIVLAPIPAGAAPKQLSAKEILEDMESAYGSFRTYTDRGMASDSSTKLTREFKTIYDRQANRFLFESEVKAQPFPRLGRNFLAVC